MDMLVDTISFCKRWLFIGLPIIAISLAYIFLPEHQLNSLELNKESIENLTTAISIIAGFSGSILISLLVTTTPLLEKLRQRPENFEEFINCFWFSIIFSLISIICGVVLLLLPANILSGFIKEVILSIWLGSFLACLIKFCQGFSYALEKLKPKK